MDSVHGVRSSKGCPTRAGTRRVRSVGRLPVAPALAFSLALALAACGAPDAEGRARGADELIAEAVGDYCALPAYGSDVLAVRPAQGECGWSDEDAQQHGDRDAVGQVAARRQRGHLERGQRPVVLLIEKEKPDHHAVQHGRDEEDHARDQRVELQTQTLEPGRDEPDDPAEQEGEAQRQHQHPA